MKNMNNSQLRHEMLVDFLAQFEIKLPKVKESLSTYEVKNINSDDIRKAVCVFLETLNINVGSGPCDIELFQLLQAYLTIPACRKEINSIAMKAQIDDWQKSKK